jgi:hypothetical protein
LSKERGATTAAAYVPLSFASGEAYQFDWSHEVVLLNGVTVTVKAAHVRLCHSRMLFVRAYPRETQEMVFDVQDRAFALFKGAWRDEALADEPDLVLDLSLLPARRRRAGDRIDEIVAAHLQETAIVATLFADGGPSRYLDRLLPRHE